MPFVMDASVTLSWALEDESDSVGTAAFERLERDEARVPSLWWFEVRNGLLVNERRGRIAAAAVDGLLQHLPLLPIVFDRSPDEGRLMALARRHKLTAYDAAYLELAERLQLSLATIDGPLARAARAAHVELLRPTH